MYISIKYPDSDLPVSGVYVVELGLHITDLIFMKCQSVVFTQNHVRVEHSHSLPD